MHLQLLGFEMLIDLGITVAGSLSMQPYGSIHQSGQFYEARTKSGTTEEIQGEKNMHTHTHPKWGQEASALKWKGSSSPGLKTKHGCSKATFHHSAEYT